MNIEHIHIKKNINMIHSNTNKHKDRHTNTYKSIKWLNEDKLVDVLFLSNYLINQSGEKGGGEEIIQLIFITFIYIYVDICLQAFCTLILYIPISMNVSLKIRYFQKAAVSIKIKVSPIIRRIKKNS